MKAIAGVTALLAGAAFLGAGATAMIAGDMIAGGAASAASLQTTAHVGATPLLAGPALGQPLLAPGGSMAPKAVLPPAGLSRATPLSNSVPGLTPPPGVLPDTRQTTVNVPSAPTVSTTAASPAQTGSPASVTHAGAVDRYEVSRLPQDPSSYGNTGASYSSPGYGGTVQEPGPSTAPGASPAPGTSNTQAFAFSNPGGTQAGYGASPSPYTGAAYTGGGPAASRGTPVAQPAPSELPGRSAAPYADPLYRCKCVTDVAGNGCLIVSESPVPDRASCHCGGSHGYTLH